jgi:hypothetical protein
MKLRLKLAAPPLKFVRFNRTVPPTSSFIAAAIFLFSLLLSSCGSGGGGGNGGGNGAQTFTVVMSPTSPVIAVGDTEQFTGGTVDSTTGNPVTINGLTYAWSSSDTSIATIDATTGLATAVAFGTTTIEVMATNSDNNGVGNFETMLKIVNPLTTITPPLPLGALTIPYPTTTLGSGGAAPLTWSLVNGTTLPAGLTLASNGSISGTPTVAGVSPSVTVQVTDSETPPASQQLTFTITTVDPANPCSLLTNTNPSMLAGSYAFLLQGFQATTANGTPFAIAGSFAANGSGTVTGGEVDVNTTAGPQHLTVNGGVYAVTASGQGCLQLKYTSGASNVFHFALSQLLNPGNIATYGRIIEFDGYQGMQGGAATNLASGVLLLQNPAEFSSSSLAARFAFGTDGFDMAGKHVAIGGSFSFNNANGNLSNFAQDFDDGGTISTVTGATGATSSTATTGTTGRETVTLSLPGPTTLHLASYIVNANEMLLISTDTLSASVSIYSGRAIVTGSSYTANSLSGDYIYRAEGVDYQGDGAACAASGPCALTDVAVMNADAATGALGGTLYQLQAGATQTSTITNTYSVSSSTGRVQLSSASGGTLPVFYLATPVTSGTDATESIAAFIVGSGPTPNSSSGDPTALFGFIEAQPNGPYGLNSPPTYILASEDPMQITDNNVIGNGSFSAGAISPLRDVSAVGGLIFNGSVTFSLTLNPDGTLGGTATGGGSVAGATNSTPASPGKALVINTTNAVAAIRLFEP